MTGDAVCVEQSRLPFREKPTGEKTEERIMFCNPLDMKKEDFPLFLRYLLDDSIPDEQRFCWIGESARAGKPSRPATVNFNIDPPPDPASSKRTKTSKPKKTSGTSARTSKKTAGVDPETGEPSPKKKKRRKGGVGSDEGDGGEVFRRSPTPHSVTPDLDDGSGDSSSSTIDEEEVEQNPEAPPARKLRTGRTSKPPPKDGSNFGSESTKKTAAGASVKTAMSSKSVKTNQSVDGNPIPPRERPTPMNLRPTSVFLSPSKHTSVRSGFQLLVGGDTR